MRLRRDLQLSLLDCLIDGECIERDPILEAISDVLDGAPVIHDLVHEDLCRGLKKPRVGRKGLTAEQVIRFAILLRRFNWTYREARDRTADSLYLRQFVRLGWTQVPKYQAFNRAILKLTPKTIRTIHTIVLEVARALEIETGHVCRADTTVVETNVRYPSDSGLMWDCVRLISRLVHRLAKLAPELLEGFPDRTRRAKRRMTELNFIARTKRGDSRKKAMIKPYRDLFLVTREILAQATTVLSRAKRGPAATAVGVLARLEDTLEATDRVLNQTFRRVFCDETVPATEKICSIFEPHTAIIRRGKIAKPTEFGRKVLLQDSASGIITDYDVLHGNPPDHSLVNRVLDNHEHQHGGPPNSVFMDRGFHSNANVAECERRGIEMVGISRPGKKPVNEDERLARARATKSRAGIEGRISVLKRGRGLDRCRWKGAVAFGTYVGLAVVTNNLLAIAKHLRN